MTLFLHEIKRNKLSLIIWTAAISFMLGVCVIIYPEMASEMEELSDMFSNMGAFSNAFGMDQLQFGEFTGYFVIECGNTLGIGGALFAAILGINALSKEERDHTADFLLSHPVSRARVITEKLISVIVQIIAMNIVIALVCAGTMLIIDVEVKWSTIALLLLSYLILQIEIAAITFCISAFLKKGGLGLGIGVSLGFYFVNIIANISEDVEFLKYLTPFAYVDGSHIINEGNIELKHLVIGAVVSIVALVIAYKRYTSKDIS